MRHLAVLFITCCDRQSEALTTNPNPNPTTEPAVAIEASGYSHQVFGPRCEPFATLPAEQKVDRYVEIDYPKGSDRHTIPGTFDDIVNAEVVERAMAIYGCTNHMHDQRDLTAIVLGVNRGHDLSIEGLNYFVRTMAYVNLGIDSLATQETVDEYVVRSGEAKRIVRMHLKDPDNLRAEYRRYKPLLVAGYKQSLAPEVTSDYLNKVVIPYFTEPVPEHVLGAERALLAVEAKCEGFEWERGGAECYEDERAARQALIAITPDYRVLQWMHRRESEGGEALVQAWGEILTDFAGSI